MYVPKLGEYEEAHGGYSSTDDVEGYRVTFQPVGQVHTEYTYKPYT